MRKSLLILFMFIFSYSLINAQYERIWENSVAQATYPTFFSATGSTERGMAYGTVGGQERVYVVSRNAGTWVYVFDAATGDSVGKLDMTGIAGGTFPLNDIEVTKDGAIFAANLTTNSSTSNFKVYKWTDESSAPQVVVDYKSTGTYRLGDKITVTGYIANSSVTIWTVAATQNKVIKFTSQDNGATFAATEITLSNGVTGNSPALYPNNDESQFYLKGNGKPLYRYNIDGTVIDTLSTGVIGTGSNAIRYFEEGEKKFVVLYHYGAGNEKLRVAEVTNGLKNGFFITETPSLGGTTNGNGTGDVDLKINGDGTFVHYFMSTNNGVAAYKFSPPTKITTPVFTPAAGTYYDSLNVEIAVNPPDADIYYTLDGTTPNATSTLYEGPISVTDTTTIKAIAFKSGYYESDLDSATYNIIYPETVATIAELRAGVKNSIYKLTGEAVLTFQQPFRGQKFIQDTTAGILIDDPAFKVTSEYQVGDGLTGIIGQLLEYGGMMEFTPVTDPGAATSSGNEIVPVVISMTDFKGNFEVYESEVVTINNVTFLDGNGTNTFANGKVYKITDGVDTIDFRTTFYDVDYISTEIPATAVNLTGIPNSRTGSSGGSFMTARNFADLGFIPPQPDSLMLYWQASDAGENMPYYFTINNYERGMAYGKVNGKERVYAVTRNGAHRIIVHNAKNGAIEYEIPKPPQAEGVGLFHLNAVDVSDDGVIFVCNMSLGSDANHPFRVYRWDNETDSAVTVISMSDGLGRMGDAFSVYGSASDNSLTIYAGISASDKIVKFTTTDNGMTFIPQVITLGGTTLGSVPNVAQASDGTIYVKSYGKPLGHFNPDGTLIDNVSTDVVGSSATKINYLEFDGEKFLMVYYNDPDGSGGNEKLNVVSLTDGDKRAYVAGYSASIGDNSNINATGSVDYMVYDDSTLVFFVLGSNNGIGAFSTRMLEPEMAPLTELEEGFENEAFAPDGWVTFASNVTAGDVTNPWRRSTYKAIDGSYSAYMPNYSSKSECWLVTPAIKLGQPNSYLSFLTQDDYNEAQYDFGSTLDIMVSTNSQTDPTDFSLLYSIREEQIYNSIVPFSVDLTAIQGAYAYVAFRVVNFGDPNDVNAGGDNWVLDQIKLGNQITDVDEEIQAPVVYSLSQNYPNPFNPATRINFSLKVDADVTVRVYNIIGQEVAMLVNNNLKAGNHYVDFNASNLSSGVYIYNIQATGIDGSVFSNSKKMMFLK